jgi:hypothetical protein
VHLRALDQLELYRQLDQEVLQLHGQELESLLEQHGRLDQEVLQLHGQELESFFEYRDGDPAIDQRSRNQLQPSVVHLHPRYSVVLGLVGHWSWRKHFRLTDLGRLDDERDDHGNNDGNHQRRWNNRVCKGHRDGRGHGQLGIHGNSDERLGKLEHQVHVPRSNPDPRKHLLELRVGQGFRVWLLCGFRQQRSGDGVARAGAWSPSAARFKAWADPRSVNGRGNLESSSQVLPPLVGSRRSEPASVCPGPGFRNGAEKP